MKVTVKVEGTTYYCFKCNAYHFESSFNSPRERLRRQKTFDALQRLQADKDYSLPADFSHSIPHQGLTWLGVAGWTLDMIARYNIGWSQELNRVILPVVDNCTHIGYTARAVESWQQPKYLEMCPSGVMWKSSNITSGEKLSNKHAVICEDILSAGRCGEFMLAYSILGTSLDTSQLLTFKEYKKVYLWLDPDKGGIKGVQGIIHRLSMVTDVKVIRSQKDPKLLTDNEIRRYLCI